MRLFALFITVLLVSCGPVHQAIQPSAETIRGLNRIAVVVPSDGAFIVFLDRATATPAPAVLFGLIGAAIASAHNESRDTERMTALNPHLAGFSARETFVGAFSQAMKQAGKDKDVQLFDQVPDSTETTKFDAVLTFKINYWGLRLANRDEERLAPFVELQTKLIRSADSQPLWDMHDTFLGQKRAYLSDYKEDGAMLRNEMKETIANAGTRMAIKIIYPRGDNK